jgi:hypothetical protein
MEFNRGDYAKLTEGASQEVGVVWEIHRTDIESIQVYWWAGGNRWSKYYEAEEFDSRAANRNSGLRYQT